MSVAVKNVNVKSATVEQVQGTVIWNFTATTGLFRLEKVGTTVTCFLTVIEAAADSSNFAQTNAFIPLNFRPSNTATASEDIHTRDNSQSWNADGILDIKPDGTIQAYRTPQRSPFSATAGIRGVGFDPLTSDHQFSIKWTVPG